MRYTRKNRKLRKQRKPSRKYKVKRGGAPGANANAELTYDQWRQLPSAKKALYIKVSVQTGRQEYTDYWVPITSERGQEAIKRTLAWKVDNDPNEVSVKVGDREYEALTPAQKALFHKEKRQVYYGTYADYMVRPALDQAPAPSAPPARAAPARAAPAAAPAALARANANSNENGDPENPTSP